MINAIKKVKYNSLLTLWIPFPSNSKALLNIPNLIILETLNAGAWNVVHDNLALQLGNSEKAEKALESAIAELQLKCISINCDTVASITPTYSDLAANGKILLHLGGTAGYV